MDSPINVDANFANIKAELNTIPKFKQLFCDCIGDSLNVKTAKQSIPAIANKSNKFTYYKTIFPMTDGALYIVLFIQFPVLKCSLPASTLVIPNTTAKPPASFGLKIPAINKVSTYM